MNSASNNGHLDVVRLLLENFLDIRRYENLHDSYFRLQGPGALGKMDLTASDKLEEIEKLAEEYLISEQGQALVSQCAWKLHRSIRWNKYRWQRKRTRYCHDNHEMQIYSSGVYMFKLSG